MSTFSDLGQKHAVGMGHNRKAHKEEREPDGFFGHFSDMGQKDAIGVHSESEKNASHT